MFICQNGLGLKISSLKVAYMVKVFIFDIKKQELNFSNLFTLTFYLVYRKAKIVDSKKKRFCLVMSLYKISDLMTMFSSITFEDFFKDSKNPRNCSSK